MPLSRVANGAIPAGSPASHEEPVNDPKDPDDLGKERCDLSVHLAGRRERGVTRRLDRPARTMGDG